jgi:hypothetical protein
MVGNNIMEFKAVWRSSFMSALRRFAEDLLYPLIDSTVKWEDTTTPYTVTPTMSLSTAQKLKRTIHGEPWIAGRDFTINEASNTITLSNRHGREALLLRQSDIPLRYHGIPVIPHYFNLFVNPLPPRPPELEGRLVSQTADGLSNAQLHQLLSFIPGFIQTIDFYLDRNVLITIKLYSLFKVHEAQLKVGGNSFSAWGCNFIFIWATEGIKIQRQILVRESQTASNETGPGSAIHNSAGTKSTFGTYLRPKTGAKVPPLGVDLFTVSAHSFLTKERMGYISLCAAVALSVRLGVRWTSSEFLPKSIMKQFFLIRTGIFIQDCLWKYFGKRLGFHHMVFPLQISSDIPVGSASSGQIDPHASVCTLSPCPSEFSFSAPRPHRSLNDGVTILHNLVHIYTDILERWSRGAIHRGMDHLDKSVLRRGPSDQNLFLTAFDEL